MIFYISDTHDFIRGSTLQCFEELKSHGTSNQKMFQVLLQRTLTRFYHGQRSQFQESFKGGQLSDGQNSNDTLLGNK